MERSDMSQFVNSAGERGGARCSGLVCSEACALGVNVVRHPTFDRPAVVNRRRPGPKRGVASLPFIRRQVTSSVSLAVVLGVCQLDADELRLTQDIGASKFGAPGPLSLADLGALARELVAVLATRKPHLTRLWALRGAAALVVLAFPVPFVRPASEQSGISEALGALLRGPLRRDQVRALLPLPHQAEGQPC